MNEYEFMNAGKQITNTLIHKEFVYCRLIGHRGVWVHPLCCPGVSLLAYVFSSVTGIYLLMMQYYFLNFLL